MINKIDDIKQLEGFIKEDIYYIRIMSLIKAYGCKYDFACFYRQIDENDMITAIISRLDGDYTLCFNDNADMDELREFFTVMGYSTILCDKSFEFTGSFDDGAVMSTEKRVERPCPYCEIDRFPKLMELFNFVDYDTADFEAWYVDISHRIRHGCARAYTLNINDEIVSSGIFSSIYNDSAILSAVQTSSAFRNMGYASALITEMLSDIRGKVFLMREMNLNEQFYIRLGFENIGKWRMYK
ncbi:MAG: GNAT family N-acetyltransferase [Eubacterium sp.]|nr:GNAT family N-acetyltransferase [Eubacterium sp.]